MIHEKNYCSFKTYSFYDVYYILFYNYFLKYEILKNDKNIPIITRISSLSNSNLELV